jgi:hypothetical protein
MKITHRQLIKLIRESIETKGHSEAEKVRAMLTSDDIGSVKQGLEFMDMLDIELDMSTPEKQFFETLAYFLNNRHPELVEGDYYLNSGGKSKIPAHLASLSMQESISLYDGISSSMGYGWMSEFKNKRQIDHTFYSASRVIANMQEEHKDVEAYGMGDDYHAPVSETGDDMLPDGISREEYSSRLMGEIEDSIDRKIDSLNVHVHAAMNAIISYLDSEGQVSFDMEY